MSDSEAVRAIPEYKLASEPEGEVIFNGTVYVKKTLLTTRKAEAYKQGQMNPKVGFLRQYLNERPVMSDGSLWTDEDILRFLRIPFTTNPKETHEAPTK
jgi:hypothetical protein